MRPLEAVLVAVGFGTVLIDIVAIGGSRVTRE